MSYLSDFMSMNVAMQPVSNLKLPSAMILQENKNNQVAKLL